MNYPPGYYFTKEHEWVFIRDGYAYIGITELVKKELQEIKNIEIHRLGEQLDADQAFGRIRSIRYLCKLIMPFSGKIGEVNWEYCKNPSEFNSIFDEKHWI